ncbi:hypothetical protein SLA2020_010520 [Shorea laevis]
MLHPSHIYLLNSKNRTQAHLKMPQQAHNGPHLLSSSQIPEKGGPPDLRRFVPSVCYGGKRLAWLFAREGGDELMKIGRWLVRETLIPTNNHQ